MVHSNPFPRVEKLYGSSQIIIMENDLKELLRTTNMLCGKVFELCRKDATKENKALAVVATASIRETLRLFEHKR